MNTRTVGVEEELLLVDPATRGVADRSAEVLKEHREHGAGRRAQDASEIVDQELFRHQVETRTDPHTDLEKLREQLVGARRAAGEAAEAAGLALVSSGTAPIEHGAPQVSPDERYQEMVRIFGETARGGRTCGTHVHVRIDSPEEGVAVIDRITPWLPVLLALGANSPFVAGRDTQYASWRAQTWTRWPTAGPTEAFGSYEGYLESARQLLMTGAARDEKMLYYDARLSTDHPTVEIRLVDACTDPDDVVLVAALVRALVATAADGRAADEPFPPWRAEVLRAAQWRAARFGLAGALVHPVRRELAAARDAVDALVGHVRERLEAVGDLPLVEAGVERVLREGGATAQRRAFERTGTVEGVVDDLIERTERSWSR